MSTRSQELERSQFSQNGEDGLIEFFLAHVRRPSRLVVELGCGNGLENCSTAVLVNRPEYYAIAVDRDARALSEYYQLAKGLKFLGRVLPVCLHLTTESVLAVKRCTPAPPDLLIVDLDSTDYWIVSRLLEGAWYPAVLCLEYNAQFGGAPVTVHNVDNYFAKVHSAMDFGAGLAAWKYLLEPHGYRFVCVESAGVNAFFVKTERFEMEALRGIQWLEWADYNNEATQRFGPTPWHRQLRALSSSRCVWLSGDREKYLQRLKKAITAWEHGDESDGSDETHTSVPLA